MVTPRPPTRAIKPCRTSTVAWASCRARWSGATWEWKTRASEDSLWLGASSRVTRARASRTVSRTVGPGQGVLVAAAAALRKEMSKRALWATRTASPANSRKLGSTDSIRGAEATMALVMPVKALMTGGMGTRGLTRLWNSPSTSPPRTLTAPNSVMWSPWALPPVVSRSTTTKVTSCRGVPRSSSVPWIALGSAAGLGWGRSRGRTSVVVDIGTTVETTTDNPGAGAIDTRRKGVVGGHL